MSNPVMTYVINTRNKLPMLREVMARLLKNARGGDEEIVVIDGASTDGTADYLAALRSEGRIHDFLSEPDKGEAHGWNKGFLRARGELIKIISDDDAYDWSAIHTCRDHLLARGEIDLIATNGGTTNVENPHSIALMDGEPLVRIWNRARLPFSFCGLGLMIRRRSLALTGLFHTGFARVDAEFLLRVTSLPVKLQWWTGCTFVRIMNAGSNSRTLARRVKEEARTLDLLYKGQPIRAKTPFLTRMRRSFEKRMRKSRGSPSSAAPFEESLDLAKVFDECDAWLRQSNPARAPRFIPE